VAGKVARDSDVDLQTVHIIKEDFMKFALLQVIATWITDD